VPSLPRAPEVTKRPDGTEHATHFSPTGVPAKEVVKSRDGTEHTKQFGPDGKTVNHEVIKRPDGTQQATHIAPDGTQQTTHFSRTGTAQQQVVRKPDGSQHTQQFGADGKTVRQEVVKKPDGTEQTTHLSALGIRQKEVVRSTDGAQHTTDYSVGGRPQREVLQKPDGSQHTKLYASNGQVKQEVVVKPDGAKAITNNQLRRDGPPRVETINIDNRGRPVSKTVIVNNTTIVRNTTVINSTVINRPIERHYVYGHYGYVYRPVYVVNSPVFVSWYDPYWYPTPGVLVVHPFHYSWGWDDAGWYRCHRHYWATYEVYPAPSYWVTDWLVASYVADRYANSVSLAQAQEEARIAREETEKARQLAAQASQDAERAEAKAALSAAEARAAAAEARANRAEAEEARIKGVAADKPNPNATPIDEKTKEALKNQIEKEIELKKQIAEGKAVLPDLSIALADPAHIYPVSKTTSVILAKDQTAAGSVTEGDLLKLEAGQEATLKGAGENTFVTMKVMNSKGDDGEVQAGTLISVPLRDLQEFDSEFRAKLDQGLAEAEKNKDAFKKGT